MARKTPGVQIYNILLREATKINNSLPDDRKLSLKDRRKLISEKIYPLYKGKGKRNVKLYKVREQIVNRVRRIPKKPTCDVTLIPPDVYEEVPYYEIDSFFTEIIPNCVWVKVSAANFGETSIFNTREYNYYNTKIADITNRINEWVRKQPQRRGGSNVVPIYQGSIQIKPGKKNDGHEESYYLEMVLTIKGVAAKKIEQVELPGRTKKEKEKQKSVRKIILEKTKGILMEKSKVKKVRRNLIKDIQESKRAIAYFKRNKYLLGEVNVPKLQKNAYEIQVKKLEKYHDKKEINDRQFKSLVQTAKAGFNQLKRKGKGTKGKGKKK